MINNNIHIYMYNRYVKLNVHISSQKSLEAFEARDRYRWSSLPGLSICLGDEKRWI